MNIYEHEQVAIKLEELYNTYKDEDLSKYSIDEVKKIHAAMKHRTYYHKYFKIFYFKPLEWHRKFFKMGSTERMRASISANRTGKSYGGAFEFACHALGWYPNWWDGVRFNKESYPDEANSLAMMLLGVDFNQMAKPQAILELIFGDSNNRGCGFIPKDFISSIENKAGYKSIPGRVYIKHSGGDNTLIDINTYSQGQDVLMGAIY